jgi:hypothetical protein
MEMQICRNISPIRKINSILCLFFPAETSPAGDPMKLA